MHAQERGLCAFGVHHVAMLLFLVIDPTKTSELWQRNPMIVLHLSLYPKVRYNTGIYPRVMGTRHFGKRAYPDPWVFSPVGIIGGYPRKMHCLPREYPS